MESINPNIETEIQLQIQMKSISKEIVMINLFSDLNIDFECSLIVRDNILDMNKQYQKYS